MKKKGRSLGKRGEVMGKMKMMRRIEGGREVEEMGEVDWEEEWKEKERERVGK